MKSLRSAAAVFGFVVFLCCVFPQPVYAYLDPGTGSYLLQLLIAGLFSALFFLKNFWARTIGLFKKPKNVEERPNDEQRGSE